MGNGNEYFEAALIAGLIVLVGVVVCSQAPVAAMTELAIAAAMGLFAACRFAKGEKSRAAASAAKALIFAGTFVIGTGVDLVNKKIAFSRAETVIAACRAYKEKTGAYPETLQALVPAYLKEVPRAKYTLLWGAFQYGEGRLALTLVPMSVMPSYDLAAGTWSFNAGEAVAAVLGRSRP